MSTSPTERSPIELLGDGRPVRLLGVWAHPDDEAYLSAGLVQRVVGAGGRAMCLTATRGELGVPPDDRRPADRIRRLRESELRSSLAELGAHSLRLLGHPDGGCAQVPLARGVAEVRRAIEATRPDLVVTFGPDGVTGHADHLAVCRWATEAWRQTGQGELLYAVMADAFLDRYRALHDAVGIFGDHVPVGTAADALDLVVDLDDRELDRKRRALAAHASQTVALAEAMGEATYRTWWASECFRRPTAFEVSAAEDDGAAA